MAGGPGAGSIAGMIISLRNNARPRRKIFKAYKEFVVYIALSCQNRINYPQPLNHQIG